MQGVRIIVTVECTESKAIGATPSRYCTQKVSQNSLSYFLYVSPEVPWTAEPVPYACVTQNRKNTPERLELQKYNPNLSECLLLKYS